MRLRNPLFVAVVAGCAILIAACGGGMQAPPPAPTFTSTPGTVAAEGAVYTYQVAATDPKGGTISFTLGSVPTGATLTGNTLTWTPTPQESRVANSFAIMATTAEGGAASQTWSVTPAGTVHITRVDTEWTATGPVMVPFDWTRFAGELSQTIALVPQADGSFKTFTGTGNTDGTFSIPNVPGGYYWLRIFPLNTYWTSTSNFDFGTDTLGSSVISSVPPPPQTTTFDLSVSGLDPWQAQDFLNLRLDNGFDLGFLGLISPGATSGNVQGMLSTNLDFTTVKSAFVWQTEPLPISSLNANTLGPSAQISNLSLTNGGTNTLSATLTAPPKSTMSLAVQGSDWANLYNNAASVTATPLRTTMSLTAQPYFTGGLIGNSFGFGPPPPSLFSANTGVVLLPPLAVIPGPEFLSGSYCSDGSTGGVFSFNSVTANSATETSGPAPIVTNQNFGSFQYGDPFPAQWLRPFFICQQATVTIPDASSSSPIQFLLGNGAITAAPTAPVTPLVSIVQNPMINGQSLFTASTLGAGPITLNWTAPSGAAPNTYEVRLFLKTTLTIPTPPTSPTTIVLYLPTVRLFTKQTNITLPYTLPPGQNFLVEITALVDGRANFETSPLRSGLPKGGANVISALMTATTTLPTAAHGNGLELKPDPNVAAAANEGPPRRIVIRKPQ